MNTADMHAVLHRPQRATHRAGWPSVSSVLTDGHPARNLLWFSNNSCCENCSRSIRSGLSADLALFETLRQYRVTLAVVHGYTCGVYSKKSGKSPMIVLASHECGWARGRVSPQALSCKYEQSEILGHRIEYRGWPPAARTLRLQVRGPTAAGPAALMMNYTKGKMSAINQTLLVNCDGTRQ